MINQVISTHDQLIQDLKAVFVEHKKSLSEVLPTPFRLWMASKIYLALSETELDRDARMLRQCVDLSMNRSFCVEDCWASGNMETYFMLLAVLELDRREHPDDPSKEILFCHYEPREKDKEEFGWYDPSWYDLEKVEREHQKIKDRSA